MSSDKSQAAQRQLCPAGRDKRVLSMGDTSKEQERLVETYAGRFCNFLRNKKLRENDYK